MIPPRAPLDARANSPRIVLGKPLDLNVEPSDLLVELGLDGQALVVLAALALAAGIVRLWREQQKTYTAFLSAQRARDNEREAVLLTFAASDPIAERALWLISAAKPSQTSYENELDKEFWIKLNYTLGSDV